MNSPVCSICAKEITDWIGNIMIDLDAFKHENRIKGLCVMCKKCTAILDHENAGPDQPGIGKELYHFLWDLRWVRDRYDVRFSESFNDLYLHAVWDQDALAELIRVVRICRPDFLIHDDRY